MFKNYVQLKVVYYCSMQNLMFCHIIRCHTKYEVLAFKIDLDFFRSDMWFCPSWNFSNLKKQSGGGRGERNILDFIDFRTSNDTADSNLERELLESNPDLINVMLGWEVTKNLIEAPELDKDLWKSDDWHDFLDDLN